MSYKRARVLFFRAAVTYIALKMQLWITGFLCISAVRFYPPAVDASPFGPATAGGSASFRTNTGQSAPFAEGLRDWFRSVKNRIVGATDVQAQPPQEAANLIMQLENEDPQERRRNNPGGFFLDLSNLTFNPDRDWGFRLGQWYFIRKQNDDPPPAVDWNASNYPEWPTMDDGKDYDMPPLGTIKSIDESTIFAVTPGEEVSTVTEVSSIGEPKDSDNETRNNPEGMQQSAEVLIPSK